MNKFIKSTSGTVTIEAAFMFLLIIPLLYFIAIYGILSYSYNGKVIETTRQLADYINKWDDWNIDRSNTNKSMNLPDAIDAFRKALNIPSPYYPSANSQPSYNRGSINHKIYAAYITNTTPPTIYICATLTSLVTPSSGTFPPVIPSLDPFALTVPGPVWIVQSVYRFRGINLSHIAVRRPLGFSLTVVQYGISYTCSPSMTPITYP